MNTSTSAPSTAPVKAHPGAQQAAKKTGSDAPADLFSNLMSLVSATHGEPAAELPAQAPRSDTRHETPDPHAPGTDNPVHALLNWASPAALAATAATNAALAGDTAPGLHTAVAGQANAATQGIELVGMKPLDAGAPLDAEAAAALALASAPTASATGTATVGNAQVTATALASASREHGGASQANQTAETPLVAKDAANAATERMGAEGSRPAGPGRPDMAQTLGTRAATVNGTWRKAPAHAAAAAAHEMGSLRALAADGMTGRLGAQGPLVRSTVAMHERVGQATNTFAAATAAAEASALGTPGLPLTSARTGEAPAATPGAAVSDLLNGNTSADALGGEDAPHDLAQPDPLANPDPEAEQISHWGSQNLRHASLRVGQGGEDAIDIQLSMSGQEVRVDFRTDNAETRASLQQSAGESLGELLQRSGIQLGDVSVGAQGQRQDGGAERRETGASQGRRPTEATAEPRATPAVAQPRADGSQPLDVFA